MANAEQPGPGQPSRVVGGDPQPDEVELDARRGDIKSVLAQLNARTRHRFTGLFRFEAPNLRTICLFDRENPSLDVSGAASVLEDTYCAIVGETSTSFFTVDARTDERLPEPRVRGRMVSYGGVLVTFGALRGTLCHYDSRPRLLRAREVAYLEKVAPLVAPFLATGD